ncbi:threonine synthase [bacterium]|nr:threonine synthase [bacterium]
MKPLRERAKMEYLECLFCQKKFPLNIFNPFCPDCGAPLLYFYPPQNKELYLDKENPLERALDFLPLNKVNLNLTLGEGNTPLIKLSGIMNQFNFPSLYAKNETTNPTYSFKDRGTAVALQKAVSLGIKNIGTVSTGNMAASTSAFGAKAGLKTMILLKEDTSREKLLSSAIHSPTLIKVKGDYGKLFYKSFSVGKSHRIYFMNSVDPFRIEGYKITGFEIFLHFNQKAPDYIVVPVSSGGHLIGLMRAFLDLKKQGLIQKTPTFVGVQAKGCSPIAQAFSSGYSRVKRIQKGRTIAHGISNPDPPGGNIVLQMIKENNGFIIDSTDKQISSAQKSLAQKEGIFCQASSAAALAGLYKLSSKTQFKPEDRIVLILTGSGLKAMEELSSMTFPLHKTSLPQLESLLNHHF